MRIDEQPAAVVGAVDATAAPAPVARWVRLLPYALWAVLTAAYATLSLQRYSRFETPSWDNAIFTQALAGYAHLGLPVVDIKEPGYNLLGDHFSPIVALLAPAYRLFPDGRTLLVAQAVLIGFSVVPIARVATRRLGASAGAAIAVAYGLSFGIASAVWVDFHEVAFAAPLLALAGAAYVERRWALVVGWSVLLLLVKEDLGLTVVAVGVALALSGARRPGALLVLGGLAGLALVLFVLIPAANPAGGYDYVGVLGGGTGTDAGPFATLFTAAGTKLWTLVITFGVTGFLALRSPWVLVAGPTLAWRFLGDNPYYWGTDWHYSLVLMPVVFLAMVDAVVRIGERDPGRASWLARYASHVPAVAAAVALGVLPQYPLAGLARPETYADSARAVAAEKVLDKIPVGASVETDVGLMTHLAADRDVYWTGTIGSDVTPDYVLVDVEAGWSAVPDVVRYAEQGHPGTTYEQVASRGGYLLARRVG